MRVRKFGKRELSRRLRRMSASALSGDGIASALEACELPASMTEAVGVVKTDVENAFGIRAQGRRDAVGERGLSSMSGVAIAEYVSGILASCIADGCGTGALLGAARALGYSGRDVSSVDVALSAMLGQVSYLVEVASQDMEKERRVRHDIASASLSANRSVEMLRGEYERGVAV